MGRSPSCIDEGVKKGPWTSEEDGKLRDYINLHGHGSWKELPHLAGLHRSGKSCRLRWTNYLRPDIKRGKFDEEEEEKIIQLHAEMGNKWAAIASQLPGRTDNEIKNHWNTQLRKKLMKKGIDPVTHKPRPELNLVAALTAKLQGGNDSSAATFNSLQLQSAMAQLMQVQLAESIIQILTTAASGLNSPVAAAAAEPYNSMASLGATYHHPSHLQWDSFGTGSLGVVSSGTPGVIHADPRQTTAAATSARFSVSSLSGLPCFPTTVMTNLINHSVTATTTMSVQQQPSFRHGSSALPVQNPNGRGGTNALTWRYATSGVPPAANPSPLRKPQTDPLDVLVAELDSPRAKTSASASAAIAPTATPSEEDGISNYDFLDDIILEDITSWSSTGFRLERQED